MDEEKDILPFGVATDRPAHDPNDDAIVFVAEFLLDLLRRETLSFTEVVAAAQQSSRKGGSKRKIPGEGVRYIDCDLCPFCRMEGDHRFAKMLTHLYNHHCLEKSATEQGTRLGKGLLRCLKHQTNSCYQSLV